MNSLPKFLGFLLLPGQLAFCMPTGPSVISGDVTFGGLEKAIEIATASERAIIEWQAFSIAHGESACFIQPSSTAVLLNRVIGNEMSELMGTLSANGVIYLINPHGIILGKEGWIDTAGFLASTSDISNQAFLEGKELLFQGESTASLTLLGTIRTESSDVHLIANGIYQKGDIQLVQEGGKILLSTTGGPLHIEKSAHLTAPSGKIKITMAEESPPLQLLGNLDVSGTTGGTIEIKAPKCLSEGALKADGKDAGGTISLVTSGPYMEVKGASYSADGEISGGEILLSTGTLFASGSHSAEGETGGTMHLFGEQIALCGASFNANGNHRGGEILVKGEKVHVNPHTVLSADGSLFGGFIEISGTELQQSGYVHASGEGGMLFLDPKFINIDATQGSFYQLIDPHLGNGVGFGRTVAVLPNGNIVVTKPQDNFAAPTAGAVYQYDNVTTAVLSILTGSSSGDQAGSGGVTVLTNGNYVVRSPVWNNGSTLSAGAATLAPSTGLTGTISVGNSLVGSTQNDNIGGGGVTALSNGNYVVISPNWTNPLFPLVQLVGAATFGDGTLGITGPVTGVNSLVGTSPADSVGSGGVKALPSGAAGNYVVVSIIWNGGVGAATFGNGLTGVSGSVNAGNSLVGTTPADMQNVRVVPLINGNYVVSNQNWNGGTGAATFGDASAGGISGAISTTNSLYGSAPGEISCGVVTPLVNGHYVVGSGRWNGNLGAATWVDGTNGRPFGSAIPGAVISAANSLTGSTAADNVSNQGIIALSSNSNYVVISSQWTNGLLSQVGAATWVDGSTGIPFGALTPGDVVSTTNSLIGGAANQNVGNGGIAALTNGNYVVGSLSWSNGPLSAVGAATWVDGNTGNPFGSLTPGAVVSPANSLIGGSVNDSVGTAIVALTNGNYVVVSPPWSNGPATSVGAVTLGNGAVGTVGIVSSANSIIGANTPDGIGGNGVTPLSTGNFVINSGTWSGNLGAVTLGSGNIATPTIEVVSVFNSLVGSQVGDEIGLGGIFPFANGNYLVFSPQWDSQRGAVTFGSGTVGVAGTVSGANSIIGLSANSAIQTPVVNNVDGTFIVTFLNNSGNSEVEVAITSLSQAVYSSLPAVAFQMNPGFITQTLNTGTNVLLQANSDITVSSPITASGGGPIGNLTLSAGRSVLINADITTAGGNLTVTANDTLANGVIDADRDPGNAVITLADGVKVNSGGGSITLSLLDGAGKTNSQSGDIAFGSQSSLIASGAGSISVFAQEHSINLLNYAQIQTQNGALTMIAGQDILALGAVAVVSSTGNDVTLVVDNLFPTSPGIGSGHFNVPGSFFSASGLLKLYTTAQPVNSFSTNINGKLYVAGPASSTEVFSTYYPAGSGGSPFTIFYKVSGPGPIPPTPPSPSSTANTIAQGLYFYSVAASDAFSLWTYCHKPPYLRDDLYPPYKTAKDLTWDFISLIQEE